MNYRDNLLFSLHVHIACEILKIYNPSRINDIDSIATYGIQRGWITKKQGAFLGGMFKHTVPVGDIGHTWWNKKFIDDGMELLMRHKSGSTTMGAPSKISSGSSAPTPSDYDRAMGILG